MMVMSVTIIVKAQGNLRLIIECRKKVNYDRSILYYWLYDLVVVFAAEVTRQLQCTFTCILLL